MVVQRIGAEGGGGGLADKGHGVPAAGQHVARCVDDRGDPALWQVLVAQQVRQAAGADAEGQHVDDRSVAQDGDVHGHGGDAGQAAAEQAGDDGAPRACGELQGFRAADQGLRGARGFVRSGDDVAVRIAQQDVMVQPVGEGAGL